MTDLLLLLAGVAVGALGACVWFMSTRRSASRPTPAVPDLPQSRTSSQTGGAAPHWQILDQLAEGVLVLDDRLRPVIANAAAGKILGLQGPDLPGRLPSQEVAVVARQAREERAEVEELLNLWYPTRSTIKTRAVPLGTSEQVLVILQDVTEEWLSQKVRREFVAHASHELKSPVASLQTLAEAVQQAADDDPQAVGRFSQKLIAEATRLGRLISDLLDLSRLEDPAHLPDEPLDLSELAEREVTLVGPLAEAKSMQLDVRIEPDIWIKGDDQQLAVMIRNLLENAIRYTPERGSVILEVRPDGGNAVVIVRDTGIGIPLEAQGRVFERFYRVDRARSRARGGTGLGLAIVKHVVELHGGEVALQSELGEGSTFTARLPMLPSGASSASLAG